MAALSRRLRPLRVPAHTKGYGLLPAAPSPRMACDAARGSRKIIPCFARGVYATYGGLEPISAEASVFIELALAAARQSRLPNFWTIITCYTGTIPHE